MITSFADKETEKVWNGEHSRRLPVDVQKVGLRKLHYLAAAAEILDLRIPPNNRLEKLSGSRKGQWSIRVNQQWRICFEWQNGNAANVEICDYH